MKRILIALLFIATTNYIQSQNLKIDKIEPPNWWSGMKWNKVQLMIYGENLNDVKAKFNDKRIKIEKIYKIDNPSYAFIDITIPKNLPPDDYMLTLSNDKEKIQFNYPILKREKGIRHQGFTNKDVMYLIMPDRFANGDVTNDSIDGYYDSMQYIPNQGRFGGDIKGIIDKLDYLKDLGITAIWCTPFVENNTFRSYHGYSATDFYKIDPRLGSNEFYKLLVVEAHKRGIKIILDHVANHFSDNHPWMKNLPVPDWINGTVEDHQHANHHKMIFTDPYADSATIKHVEQGWFVKDMVDFNQENLFVQNYIIQNTIWWVEFSGLDGIREDTQPYNYQKFISRWAETILNEFPTLNIVGEVWTGDSDLLAAYQKDTFLKKDFNTNLPSLTDFGLRDAIVDLVTNRRGLYNIYNVIAKDFLFTNPNYLLTFADNHDVDRIMYFAKGNIDKVKLAYTLIMTTRGIPCIFYGSEIGLIGGSGHGELRAPFPGGFPDNKNDAFSRLGRNLYENYFYDFMNELISLRKNNDAFTTGKMIHYPPVNDAYYYFRISGEDKFLVILNNKDTKQVVDLSPAKSQFQKIKSITDVFSGETKYLPDNLIFEIDKVSALIYKLKE